LDYSLPVLTYPIPEVAEAPPLLEGDKVVSKIDAEYVLGSEKQPKRAFVELSSTYINKNLTIYHFAIEPNDLVLAIGHLRETSVGGIIADALSADVMPLRERIIKDKLDKMPSVFAEGQFLIISGESRGLSHDIKVERTSTKTAAFPVAVFDERFTPIVTNTATLLVP
jgi:hypothetical protein